MKNTLKLLGIALFGGILSTPVTLLAQNDVQSRQDQFLKRKIVRDRYDKTYRKAEKFLEKDLRKLRKSGKIQKEITPLEWWKQEYLMTMDPQKGRPTPEVLLPVFKSLNQKPIHNRATPGSDKQPWQSRGPNEISGRTRALCWDRADSKQLRVFAGGVTGGLWVNDDISNANTQWKQVGGLWSNLNVTCIAQDPNDSKIIYVGTGEGFGTTSSSSRGYGIFKTTDGGKTWSHLSNTEEFYYINDIAVRDESGKSVLYVAVDILFYQGQWHANSNAAGLQRSTNGGSAFSNVSPFITSQSNRYIVSDIEIGADNRLWVGTRKNMYSSGSDQGGGRILYSDNGTTFTEAYKNSSALKGRVELACAPSSADTLYAVVEANGIARNVVRSFNKGTTWSVFTEPNDADNGIPSTDFTRNQAWYDLILAVNPIDASEVVIGGINFFMSQEAGNNWKQISKWSNNPGMDQLSCSYIHADMHAALYSDDGKRLAVGTDGGVFYASDVRNKPWNSSSAFVERNNHYVVTQYYAGSISQNNANFMLGGAQDNGTSYTQDTGFNKRYMLFGGDGGYCFIHPDADDALIFSYVKNNFYSYIDNQLYYLAQDNNSGSFINPAGLDYINNNLITQKGKGTLYRNDIYGNTSTLETITFATSVNDLASAFHVVERSTGKARLFIGTSLGKTYYSDNPEAATPTFTSLGSVNSGNVSSIQTLNGSLDTIFLTLTNYGINNVYVSINGGTNWTAIDGDLPNMPVWDIVANPFNPTEAIIATELGMFQCLNVFAGSPRWTPIQNGMGAVKTMMLDYNIKDGVIMAATHGRGFFTSDAWIKQEPTAYFSLADTAICENATITLIDSSINTNNTRSWKISPGNFSFTNSTDSTSKNAKVKFTQSGIYQILLEVTNGGMKSEISAQIKVNAGYNNTISITPSSESYCENEDLTLTAKLVDDKTKLLANSTLKWFKNGTEVLPNQGIYTLLIKAPLVNNDKYYAQFASDYECLSPQSANSTEYVINTSANTTLNITRVWDTLFSNYNGSGTVEWYRNNFKIATGKRYTLIDNGEFYARVVNGNCNGSKSNVITFQSLGNDFFNNVIQIGPNPNKGMLIIQSNHSESLQGKIINANGAVVKDFIQIRRNNETILDLTDYPDGMYFMEINDNNGHKLQYKLILSR